MMSRTTEILILIVVAGLVSWPKPVLAGDDPSYVRAEGVIDAGIDEVWAAWTTKEGVESWMVPVAEVDLRIGGTLKTNYDKAAGIGGPGTIVHHVLALEPKRMLAMRFDVPDTNADLKIAEKTWWVARFDPLAPSQTRVSVTQCGFGDGPEWEKARGHFEKGNAWTLKQLEKRFARPKLASGDATATPADDKKTPPDETFTLLRKLVGGKWIADQRDDEGGVLRACNVFEAGPDGRWITGKRWRGDASGQAYEALTTIWIDPTTETARFVSIERSGAIATGGIRAVDGRLIWDWNVTTPGGKPLAFRVETVFEGSDAYRGLAFIDGADGKARKVLDLASRRVAELPADFKLLE